MRHIALEIAYDGMHYSGWQIQNNAVTVQGVFQDVMYEILKGRPKIKVAGRTDAGVHALGQIVSFKSQCRMTEEQLGYALNSKLPKDIRILRVFEVPVKFHPRYSAQKRWYRYIISNAKVLLPFFKNYTLWVKRGINTLLLNEYCKEIIGTHDFTSFATLQIGDVPLRRVFECDFTRKDDFVILDIIANGFLRKMVRTIVGTFLELEKRNEKPERVSDILQAKNRGEAGKTEFPGGLYLVKVFY